VILYDINFGIVYKYLKCLDTQDRDQETEKEITRKRTEGNTEGIQEAEVLIEMKDEEVMEELHFKATEEEVTLILTKVDQEEASLIKDKMTTLLLKEDSTIKEEKRINIQEVVILPMIMTQCSTKNNKREVDSQMSQFLLTINRISTVCSREI